MSKSTRSAVTLIGDQLPTERRHPDSYDLHEMTPAEILTLINKEDFNAVAEAQRMIPLTARLVETAIACIRSGGSVHYFGAGTSGRIATQDAAELFPTFHTPPHVFQAHMAGGATALLSSVENAEDDFEAGARDAANLGPLDLAIGLAASGRTPYVIGALTAAKSNGATTAAISCVPDPEIGIPADIVVAGDTGPEVLTGSTRLKAGTFQKVLLSGFSTAVMVGLGRTFSNLMVSMVATNEKLHSRSIRILMEGSGLAESAATELLKSAKGDLKLALLSGIAGIPTAEARPFLEEADGVVFSALELIRKRK